MREHFAVERSGRADRPASRPMRQKGSGRTRAPASGYSPAGRWPCGLAVGIQDKGCDR